MTSKEQLIFAILFSDVTDYEVDIDRFCSPSERPVFREEIRNAIKKGNMTITEDRIIHKEHLTLWKLDVRPSETAKNNL